MSWGGRSYLVFRDEAVGDRSSTRFGNVDRPSESLLFVPIRKDGKPVGMLSVQSYLKHAYSEQDQEVLKALAAHCGSALQRLQAQSDLQLAEHRFVQVFNASPVAMSITAYETGRVIDVNPALLRMFNRQRHEVVGRTAHDWSIWENPENRREFFADIRAGKEVRNRQVVFKTGPREHRHVLVSVEVLKVGVERCLLFYNYDITDQVNLEAQLRQSQKMESVGQLAAGVAHDFNNLLTIIGGCANLALGSGSLNDETKGLLEEIHAASNRGVGLTRQLLTFSSRQQMATEEVGIYELITDLGKMLRRLLGGQIEMDFRCDRGLPTVIGDRGMLEQVLVNMAVNARDAMNQGDRLVISASTTDIALRDTVRPPEGAPGQYIRIQVSDTGIGIPAEHLSRIFEPFFTAKREGSNGSGLGLATAYGIVRQHGGWIRVQSKVGAGTVFSIYLPCAPVSVTGEVAGEAIPVQGKKPTLAGRARILVVEDEEPLRELIRSVLECHGYETCAASSADTAWDLWQKEKEQIDAMVTDIMMPGTMDGRDLGERMLNERKNLPVVFTSGYSQSQTGVTALLGEGRVFLPKPYEAGKLLEAVRGVLQVTEMS